MLGNDSSQDDHFSIIVIGASAGGVETLTQLVKLLPRELDAAVLVVLHFPSYGTSVLPSILSRAGTLPAKHPEDGEALRSGHIYVAPPDYHLVVEPGRVRLSHGPRENGHRPAIDPLFRSAAMAYQRRVIGVILTGMSDDGTAGLAMVKQKGGIAIAQDPEEALFNGMPTSAIANVAIDYVLPIAEIASVLVKRSNHQTFNRAIDNKRDPDVEIIQQDKALAEQGKPQKEPSIFTCPDCGGVMWELNHDGILRYRCHVGHVYSTDSLAAEQSDAVEGALWTAVRSLEERASLARRLAHQAQMNDRTLSAKQFIEKANDAAKHAQLIRQIIAVDQIVIAFEPDALEPIASPQTTESSKIDE